MSRSKSPSFTQYECLLAKANAEPPSCHDVTLFACRARGWLDRHFKITELGASILAAGPPVRKGRARKPTSEQIWMESIPQIHEFGEYSSARRQRETAVHEAAHVVVGYVLGLEIAAVMVVAESDLGKSDASGLTWLPYDPHWSQRRLKNYCRVLAAGSVAQAMFHGKTGESALESEWTSKDVNDSATSDLNRLRRLNNFPGSASHLGDYYRSAAWLVNKHRQAIKMVAVLLEKKTALGEEFLQSVLRIVCP